MNANVAIGGLMLIVGIGVTVATSAYTGPGGSYLIAWGAILFGAVQLFRGLLASPALVSDTASEQPEERIASVNARLISGSIGDDDYPSAALRDEAQGRSVVTFTVDDAGAVRDAEILQSSGHQDLDRAACDLIRKRFRFEPALDQAGKPLPQRGQQTIDWRLPEEPREELYSQPHHAEPNADDRPGEGEPWRVLSSATTRMEVFRMHEEERTVMDLVRLSGSTVELLRGALDGPAWVGNPPPPMGVTEDGVELWDPEEQASASTSLGSLPAWAEKYRSQIIQYLREKAPDDAWMAAEEEDPEMSPCLSSEAADEGARHTHEYVSFGENGRPTGLWVRSQVAASYRATYKDWLLPLRFYPVVPVSTDNALRARYLAVREGYSFGNTGDPRERFCQVDGPFPTPDDAQVPPDEAIDLHSSIRWFAISGAPMRAEQLARDEVEAARKLNSEQNLRDWDAD